MKVRRPSGALIASILAHAVIIVIFAQAIVLQRPIFDIFGRDKEEIPPPERIGFLVYPVGPTTGAAESGSAERLGPPSTEPQPRIVAPSSIPTTVPTSPKSDEKATEPPGPTTGPLVGGKGNLKGVQPRYTDPRVWPRPGAVATAPTMPKTAAEKLDSVIADILAPQKDSIKVAGKERAPGDWTFEKGGKKYGVDQEFIRLGPVSLPTAILALLPLNVTGNPAVSERERRNNAMRQEINYHARRQINDADFQKAVRAIRERKERERREREQEQAKNKAAERSAASDDR
jgi:hypothetical protein